VIQSTPLTARNGKLLGVLSTYPRDPRPLSAQQLRMLDLYARQAADFLVHIDQM
jgi:hypothetical protein